VTRLRVDLLGGLLLGGLLLGGLLLGAPRAARADDRWTEPAPGVRHLVRTSAAPLLQLHLVQIDLTRPEVIPVATSPPAEPGSKLTVPQFAVQVGAGVAVNGNYGSQTQVCGAAAGDGVLWGAGSSYPADCSSALGLSRHDNRAEIFDLASVTELPAPWVTELVSGKPTLVRAGQPGVFGCDGESPSPLYCNLFPRTAVGLSGDRQVLSLVVVDKQEGVSAGTTCPALAALLLEFGVADGFALDYAGASTLYVEAEGGLVNCPSDGGCEPRAVLNHLGVRVDPAGRWYDAQLVSQSPDPADPLVPGEVVERVVRYGNRGRLSWEPAGEAPLRLGTASPRDRPSPCWDETTWLGPTRAASLEAPVPPGGEGSFRVRLRATGPAGQRVEAFAPVVDGREPFWLDQEVTWTLTVAGPADADGDGHGEDVDCDDQDPHVHPGAVELCNGVDDDCVGGVDDGLAGQVRPLRVVWSASGPATLKVNGRLVDRLTGWPELHDVSAPLVAGANVVALEARRGGGRGGALALLWLPDGEQLPSNSRWSVATAPAEGGELPGGSTAGFTAAAVSASYGQPPWDSPSPDLPPGLQTDGLTWIWSARPEEDEQVGLRRELFVAADCPTELPGVCAAGAWGCQDGSVRCRPRIAPGAEDEVCNGLDDDCDGVVDEHLANCATSEDAGVAPPDLGPDLATAWIVVPPPRAADVGEQFAGGCSCRVAAPPGGSPLVLVLCGVACWRWRRSRRAGRHLAANLLDWCGRSRAGGEPWRRPRS